MLGVNPSHGDSAACVVMDGRLVAAIEEERIRRVKRGAGFRSEAIRFCLDHAGLKISDIEYVAIGRDPSAHLDEKVLFARDTDGHPGRAQGVHALALLKRPGGEWGEA